MTYKIEKIGPLIRLVNERNTDLSVDKLLGISIRKRFQPSQANVIGTDLSTYKVVQRGQFAYGPVTSRNGDKISIALLDEDACIISSSYTVFEVTEPSYLMPKFLMRWFARPEFDRYARFKSHGTVREIFSWDEMCDVEIPIPAIETQRAIALGEEFLRRHDRSVGVSE